MKINVSSKYQILFKYNLNQLAEVVAAFEGRHSNQKGRLPDHVLQQIGIFRILFHLQAICRFYLHTLIPLIFARLLFSRRKSARKLKVARNRNQSEQLETSI